MSTPTAAPIDLDRVSRVFEAMLKRHGKPIVYHDHAAQEELGLSHEEAASPYGLLPAFLRAGEAVWFQATGNGFELDMVEDRAGAFGYAVRAIRGGSFSAVMLSMLDVLLRIDTGEPTLYANELNRSWNLPEIPVVPITDGAVPSAGPMP